ncbi:MAG: hypothetical protein Ct9H300mP28_08530 [Pseudomonadota bacterium]|nr:MAG: hypothetical protein Ct9H300mP28_08530 [Pseudomonadota bacterium]
MAKNILFIMCDQLRADYLSCYGHPFINTPNIDKIAKWVCYSGCVLSGTALRSFTGKFLHWALPGITWSIANADPLKLGERSLGDYLQDLNYRTFWWGNLK